jgi:hypothetical protein
MKLSDLGRRQYTDELTHFHRFSKYLCGVFMDDIFKMKLKKIALVTDVIIISYVGRR